MRRDHDKDEGDHGHTPNHRHTGARVQTVRDVRRRNVPVPGLLAIRQCRLRNVQQHCLRRGTLSERRVLRNHQRLRVQGVRQHNVRRRGVPRWELRRD